MMKGTLMNVPEHFHADLQASDCPMFLYSPVHPAMQHLPYLSIFAYIFLWILVGFMHMISQCIICIHICISDTHVESIKLYFVRNSFVAHNALVRVKMRFFYCCQQKKKKNKIKKECVNKVSC